VKNILSVSCQRIISWVLFAFLFLIIVHPELAHAEKEVKSIPFNGYEMKILEISKTKIQVVFNFEIPPKEITGFIVDKPTRIVIDIIGIPSKTARASKIDLPLINKLRVGIHQDKTRIVFDSSTKSLVSIHKQGTTLSPSFTLEFQENILDSVLIEKDTSGRELKIKKQEPTPAPTKEPTPKPTEIPTTVATIIPSIQIPTEEPTPTPPLKETQSIAQLEESIKESETKEIDTFEDGKSIVKTIVFQTTSDNFISSIVVTATSLGAYTLNQTVPGEYQLTITRSKLKGDHLILPQFPPDSFKGFKYVKAEEREDSVIVSIFVNEGVRLSPYIAQDKLWVRVE
jgi:hypothetical protein